MTRSPRLGRRALLALGAATLIAPHAGAEAQWVLRGGRLLRPGQPVEEGDVTISGDEIVAVGGKADGGEIVDVSGQTITAGFVDPLTQTGLVEVSLEKSSLDTTHVVKDPIRAAFLAADGYNPAASHIAVTRLGGVTSVGVVPTGGLVSGQSAWADLDGATPAAALASRSMALHVSLEHPFDDGVGRGSALMRLRELFDDAKVFKRTPNAFERRQQKAAGASRLDLAAVVSALDKRIPVVFHADRATDLLAALELARTFGLRPVLASAAEGWKVRNELAKSKASVIVHPLDDGPRSFSARYARPDNAALLHEAGVPVSFTTGETHNARKLRQAAGNAVRAGMPKDAALAAVTSKPAEAFGFSDRYGELKAGHVANVVAWSGDPFELSTRATTVVVRGRRVPMRSRQTALFERYR